MKVKFIFLIGVFVSLNLSALGQKPKPKDFGIKSKKALDLFLQGQQNDSWRDRKTAISCYLKATELEPAFGAAWYAATEDYYLTHDFKKGLEVAEKAIKFNKTPQPLLHFFVAEFNFYNMKYDRAARYYESFINAKPLVPKLYAEITYKNLQNAKFAAEEMAKPSKIALKNMGEGVNTIGEENLPNLTADNQTIFFTSRREGCTGGYQAEYRGYTEDFYYSVVGAEGKFQPAINLGEPVNTDQNEGAPSFSPDGQFVYFAGCNRPDGLGSCDIYESKLEGDKWTKPRNLGPAINSEHWESQPCISSDGKILYFVSGRPGGEGEKDIWYSKKIDGKWTSPQNMGKPINTPGYEYTPFLHADGVSFYFSSDFHPGFGGADLFLSRKTLEGWGSPINMGYPVNSPVDDQTIFVNSSGTKGYSSSQREGGFGGWDIYEFELDAKLKPRLATFVRGTVRDSLSKKPVTASLTFIDIASRDTIRVVTTNQKSGKYLLNLPLERDYAAFVDAKGYLFYSQNFSLKNRALSEELYFDLDIDLSSIREGATIILRNIFYETAKFTLLDESQAELDHIVTFLKQNPRVKIEISGHTDNVGKVESNLVLSENRAAEVKSYLTGKGILGERIISKGYGETKPLKPNDSEENRALNRRTEFRIVGM